MIALVTQTIDKRPLSMLSPRFIRQPLLLCLGICFLGTSCRRPPPPPEPPATRAKESVENLDYLTAQAVGFPIEGHPWIAHVRIVDFDQDGLADVLVVDARTNSINLLRQSAPGTFSESVLYPDIPAVVRAEPYDIDADGDLDLLVASMGQVFPNNDPIGTVLVLENDGAQHFTPHVIAEHVPRVTDVQAGDLNGDGRPDLAVALFGYNQGEVRWFENRGDWSFASHQLLDLSGAINVCIADFTGDRIPDVAAVVSQEWEEVYLFENSGSGTFTRRVIFGSTNEDFGSSGLSVADMNRDGRPDLLYSNGDGFDLAAPGARTWHGLQWLENLGGGGFRFHRMGDLRGAYTPIGVDLDRDGAMDAVAVSGFNDWSDPKAASLVWFRNDGRGNFTPHVLAHTPTHLLALAAGDLDGDGEVDLVTGGFHAYPPFDRLSRLLIWRHTQP